MKKGFFLLFVALALMAVPARADQPGGTYKANMQQTLVRGFKNVISAPLEIPITIQEYHEKAGRPVIRHIAGFVDGAFQMFMRFGSGAWDFVAAFLPGHQEGMPVEPETLF